jgi:DNA-binding IclR family transcriptional regulator
MTDTETEATEVVTITPIMVKIIEHMLTDAKAAHNLSGLCAALDLYPGTVSPLLRRMRDAGWLADTPGGGGRVYYRFTRGTAPMLRKAIAD